MSTPALKLVDLDQQLAEDVDQAAFEVVELRAELAASQQRLVLAEQALGQVQALAQRLQRKLVVADAATDDAASAHAGCDERFAAMEHKTREAVSDRLVVVRALQAETAMRRALEERLGAETAVDAAVEAPVEAPAPTTDVLPPEESKRSGLLRRR